MCLTNDRYDVMLTVGFETNISQDNHLVVGGDILESLLNPSRKIDEKYAAYVVLTETGQLITGVIAKRTSDVVVIQPVDGKRVTIQAEEIDELTRQAKSIMPDHLLQDLTAQEAADLVAFLHKLSQKE